MLPSLLDRLIAIMSSEPALKVVEYWLEKFYSKSVVHAKLGCKTGATVSQLNKIAEKDSACL